MSERVEPPPAATRRDPETVLVVGPDAALTAARTAGVRLFARCPPVHSVLLGPCQLVVGGRRIEVARTLALPAHTPHTLLTLQAPFAAVAYLDARRYRFEDVEQLAERWRGFVPGRDDLREAFGDTLRPVRRRVDRRLLRVLDALDADVVSVAEVARQVGLSDSRMTHLMTETLGAPPRAWRAWFKLRRALHATMFGAQNLTQAAHAAGFVDSAHLTRTCKQLMGVRPAQMLPHTIYLPR